LTGPTNRPEGPNGTEDDRGQTRPAGDSLTRYSPAAAIPSSLGEFREYFDAQIAGDTIAVTRTAKEIADVILEAPLPTLMRLFAPAHRLATAAQLPRRLRSEYDLQWSPLHALTLPLAARSLKLTAWPLMLVASKLTPPIRAAAA
jgi:uncharacterized protein (DUF2236 family)